MLATFGPGVQESPGRLEATWSVMGSKARRAATHLSPPAPPLHTRALERLDLTRAPSRPAQLPYLDPQGPESAPAFPSLRALTSPLPSSTALVGQQFRPAVPIVRGAVPGFLAIP